VLALRREPEAARGELLAQMFIQFFMFDAGHSAIKIRAPPALSRFGIILNKAWSAGFIPLQRDRPTDFWKFLRLFHADAEAP
jgi:hypothetical protein